MSLEKVKELRERTNLGMSDCKKALEETGYDIDKAIEFLQKKGLKKVDPLIIPTEGMVYAVTGEHLGIKFARIVEVNCQTDFGARSENFQNFVKSFAKEPHSSPFLVLSQIEMLAKQLGEKIVVKRERTIWAEEGKNSATIFQAYNHLGGKAAVIVKGYGVPNHMGQALQFIENVALQITAMKPLYVNLDSIPKDVLEKKQAFFESEILNKPEAMVKKITEGKINKWASEVCLMNQKAIFLPDGHPKQTISSINSNPDIKDFQIIDFVRYERGEDVK